MQSIACTRGFKVVISSLSLWCKAATSPRAASIVCLLIISVKPSLVAKVARGPFIRVPLPTCRDLVTGKKFVTSVVFPWGLISFLMAKKRIFIYALSGKEKSDILSFE